MESLKKKLSNQKETNNSLNTFDSYNVLFIIEIRHN